MESTGQQTAILVQWRELKKRYTASNIGAKILNSFSVFSLRPALAETQQHKIAQNSMNNRTLPKIIPWHGPGELQ